MIGPMGRALTPSSELVGRDAEQQALAAAVEAARGSAGRVVVVEGPAGIGKTRLLDAACERAGPEFTVLRTRCAELERDLAYGVVTALFERRLADADDDERARLLAGAAALAQVPLGQGQAGASHADLHGLYWLAVNLARESPLLLVVDDLHWADEPSLRWLAYVARRLDDLPVLVLVATRGSERALIAALLGEAEVLRPAPLTDEAAAELVLEHLGTDADAHFCAACLEAAAGNPFLLVELLRQLDADGVTPTAASADGVRGVRPPVIAHAVLVRLARLPDAAQRLATAVALLDGATISDAASLAELDVDDARAAADALAREQILRDAVPLEFVHPLVADVIAAELGPAARAAGHRRAARILAARGAPVERVALHLLASERTGDAWVTARLREAAARSLDRGGAEVALRLLRRALEEPPSPEDSAAVVTEAALAAAKAGSPDAAELLDDAIATAPNPIERAELILHRAHVGVLAGEAAAMLDLLDAASAALPPDAGDVALRLEAELIGLARYDPSRAAMAINRLQRLAGGVDGHTRAERVLLAQLALESAFAGDSAARTIELAERALAAGQLVRELGPDSPVCYSGIHALVSADALDAAETNLVAALDQARRQGSALGFASASMCRSHALLARGEIGEAVADARGALDLALESGWLAMVPWMAGFLVDALLERGELDEAEIELQRPELAPWLAHAAGVDPLLRSRGRFRFERGDFAGALADLRACGEIYRSRSVHNPAFVPWRSDAALAAAALGERAAARALAAEEVELATRYGAPRALGRALRAQGLVEGGADGLALLERAVAVLADSPGRLERARAHVDLGSALRRAERRVDAREALQEGLETARAVGAIALARRAHDELEASGVRLRKMLVGGVEGLTPSERRVAGLAAHGASNVEIAQSLFVTTKTVETHLGRAYRKLGIASRRELARILGDAP
jgi:DNA-binding CsgD family transcriptional regulator